ncbi:unnamed protein product [Cylindrotheca closterium]|uniref:Uncharacterized protein n=1 Tax=Cylindrotheca closterium TaxID=2856 RepID=A0AAD2PU12_9STRA|nr:unnamed protein product [Cylindrotheca closterium]
MKGFLCVPCGQIYKSKSSFAKHFRRGNEIKCTKDKYNWERECMAYHTLHYIGPVPGKSDELLEERSWQKEKDKGVQQDNAAGPLQEELSDEAILLMLGKHSDLLQETLTGSFKCPDCLAAVLLPFVNSTIGLTPPGSFVQAGIDQVRDDCRSPKAFVASADEWLRRYSGKMIASLPGNVRYEMLAFRLDTEYYRVFYKKERGRDR